MAEFDELLALIKEHCTAERIKRVLRIATGNKDVKVSASSKEELVETNLRDAFRSHSNVFATCSERRKKMVLSTSTT